MSTDSPPSEFEERDLLHLESLDGGALRTRTGIHGPQSMQGFDAEYSDIVDYILRCTHKIWEEKNIGLIYTHYAHNTPVHQSDAELYGREAMVEGTVRSLAAFPDLRLFGDEVIWSGNDTDGFHTSHRVLWSGHHLGHSVYGPPTGRRIQRFEIAHCFVRNNRILEEWSVQDELALVRQLGLDEVELAQKVALEEAARGVPPYASSAGEVVRGRGQMHPSISAQGDPHDPDALPALIYSLVWNARMLGQLERLYAPDAVVWVPGNRRIKGPAELTAYVLGLLAAFPDGAMQLERVTWNGTEAEGYRVAARWTFQGTHRGPGRYGPPSGRRVRILGISHLEVRGGRIEREYMVWNEFALLKQIHWPEG